MSRSHRKHSGAPAATGVSRRLATKSASQRSGAAPASTASSMSRSARSATIVNSVPRIGGPLPQMTNNENDDKRAGPAPAPKPAKPKRPKPKGRDARLEMHSVDLDAGDLFGRRLMTEDPDEE